MRRPIHYAALFVAILFAGHPPAWAQQTHFDGAWWMNANPDERDGFINGFSDCAVWTMHDNSFNTTPEQVTTKITKHYETRTSAPNESVIDAWKKISISKHVATGGETWSNPHWYLNGVWWLGEREPGQLGYVEGYLSCTHHFLRVSERYSQPAQFYADHINAYLKLHKSVGKTSVAIILQRFADKKESR